MNFMNIKRTTRQNTYCYTNLFNLVKLNILKIPQQAKRFHSSFRNVINMDLLKTWNFDLFNFIINLSDKKSKDQRSVSLTNVSREPKIHYNDGEKHSDDTLQFNENESDDNFICDTFKITLRRCKTVPVHNRASIKRYVFMFISKFNIIIIKII